MWTHALECLVRNASSPQLQELQAFTMAWLQHVQLLWTEHTEVADNKEDSFLAAGQETVAPRSKAPEFFTAQSLIDYFPGRELLLTSAVFTANKLPTWTEVSKSHLVGGKGILKTAYQVTPTPAMGQMYDQAFKRYAVCGISSCFHSTIELMASFSKSGS